MNTLKPNILPSLFFYNFNVSTLSLSEFCFIRSKIKLLNPDESFTTTTKAMRTGTKLHQIYSTPYKSFNRMLVKNRLRRYSVRKHGMDIFSKDIKTKKYIIRVNGAFDDLRIISVNNKKYTVLIEVYTVSKKRIWTHEIKMKVRQLQLYMWLLKDLLDKIGFPLWIRGYVEIYSQKTGTLIKAVPVYYDNNIEEWIKYIVECYEGLRAVRIPDKKICTRCPSNIRKKCSWYIIRKRKKNE